MPNSTESILDYEVEIASLKIEDTFYLPAETGNYSVAGFEMVLNRSAIWIQTTSNNFLEEKLGRISITSYFMIWRCQPMYG